MTAFSPREVAIALQAFAALACLAAAFGLWRRGGGSARNPLIMAALGTSAVQLLASQAADIDPRAQWLVMALRNVAWLVLLRDLFAADGRDASLRPVRPVIASLALVEAMQVPLVLLADTFALAASTALLARVSTILHVLFASGMLLLIHNLYAGASAQQRSRLGRMSAALVIAWGYELNAGALAYLAGGLHDFTGIVGGVAWTAVAVLLMLDARGAPVRTLAPSRTVTFQSLSLLVIALYLFGLFTLDTMMTQSSVAAPMLIRFAGIAFAIFVAAVIASSGFRAWLIEAAGRHLFRHRYDYRTEWLRLSSTMAGAGAGAAHGTSASGDEARPLEQRAIQALADIVDSPSGLLLTPDEDGAMVLSARWNWPLLPVPAVPLPEATLVLFASQRPVVTLDRWRDGDAATGVPVPRWLGEDRAIWALVPLQVAERLVGVVVLARPAYDRRLDWEDHDLLRIVGQQIAAHLAEQQAQHALLDAARFDEFNRRMAFVMHDIKNLASQFGLVVANAERHIDKPAFRADLLVTLRSAADRMESLLGRLSQYGGHGGGDVRAVVPRDVVARALAQEMAAGLVTLGDGGDEVLGGNPDALDQALRHLVRNAIEAAGPGRPVLVEFPASGGERGIAVVDRGPGMTPEFVRGQLFRPFVSTKSDGFGIGAFEARELVRAMGGRLDVESRMGLGTRFTIWLAASDGAQAHDDRKVA